MVRILLLLLFLAGCAEGHKGFGVTRVYTWGHALLSQDQFADGQWSARFAGHDGQGSVRFLTDTNGVVTDSYDYDAFGNLIAQTVLNGATGAHEPLSPLNSHLSTPNNHLYRGEQFDPDLNLYYQRARYHNPATGRFWTQDSFEGLAADPASLHPYTFNQNDPVNRLDPSGHISMAENLQVSGLAPLVRGTFLTLWDGVNNYSYGMAGGNTLKFTTREEAYFIDSLAAGPGWKFGKENFWAAARGAPFLLNQNPNIWQGRKPCWYECIPFDLDTPVYGPGAMFPMFELEPSELLQEVSDWKHGSIVGATLHAISEHYAAAGASSTSTTRNFINNMASSLAGILEGSVSPQTYADGWRHVNDRSYQVMLREFESGSAGPWTFAQGVSTAAGDVFGYNSALEGAFGIDRGSLEQLGTSERWTRGFAGLSQIAGSMAGGLRGYNPSIGGAKLGASKAINSPAAALTSSEAKLCLKPSLRDPGLRSRIQAAIEESKRARQASKFDEFEARAIRRQRVLENLEQSRLARERSNFEMHLAREAQIGGKYGGIDPWRWGQLKKGSIVLGGVPGQTPFYFDLATAKASGLDAQILWKLLQVAPHDTRGYRTRIRAYRVTDNVRVPVGPTVNNSQHGPGGGFQYYISDFERYLQEVMDFNLH